MFREPFRVLQSPLYALLLMLLLVGCAPVTVPTAAPAAESTDVTTETEAAPEATFPVTIEHKFGSITIPAEPQRVLTIGYSEQDPVLALGVTPIAVRYWFGDHPYGVWPWAQDKLGDATPELLNMPFGELNFETIVALQPDLIVATHSGITADEYNTLTQIAPTLAQPGEYVDFGVPWQEQTRLIGRALGREARANELVAAVEAKIAAAGEAHPEFADVPVAWVSPAADAGTYWAVNPDMPPMRFLARMGFGFSEPLAEFIGDASSGLLSSERLDLLDGGILIYQAITPEGYTAFLDNQLYQQLEVVKGNHTIVFENTEVPVYGALSFSTVLSLDYAVDELVPLLADAVAGTP